MRSIVAVVLVLVGAVCGITTLYLLDCGPHAQLMRQYIADERYDGELVFYNTTLSDPAECRDQHYLEELFYWILWTPNLTLPVRISMSLVNYNISYSSWPLDQLVHRGVDVWAAAGNEGTAACGWPANQEGVWAVRHGLGNRCTNKTQDRVITVNGACSSSEATARSAARGAKYNYSITGPRFGCDNDWQWPFMYAMLGVLGASVVFVVITVFVARVVRLLRARAPPLPQL